jgi:uncharacterized protein
MKAKSLAIVASLAALVSWYAIPAHGQAVANTQPPARTLEVSGDGEAHATPDVASLNLAIETHAATAQECAGRNAALAQKVVDALKAKLGDKGKIWTGGYTLFPEYNQPREGEKAAIVGYRAENSITVETGALDLLGSLIDTAVGAGANRINYLNFSLRDESKARSEAIADAAKDAQAQAQALATSLGVKLKAIVKASTMAQVRPVPVMGRMMASMAAAAPPTPIQPNEVTVPATVSLTYEIE